jgi:flagellar secretion chaperone FliS
VTTDAGRLRYLADAVSTATPAQRIVMLYDRLGLDIERAASSETGPTAAPHVLHAQQIVAELMSSLDGSVWRGADSLAAIYGFLLRELGANITAPQPTRLRALGAIVAELRMTWFEAGQQLANGVAPTPTKSGSKSKSASKSTSQSPPTVGAWVG